MLHVQGGDCHLRWPLTVLRPEPLLAPRFVSRLVVLSLDTAGFHHSGVARRRAGSHGVLLDHVISGEV